MFEIHLAEERNVFKGDVLTSYRSFSEGDYMNFERMGFSVLETLSEVFVQKDQQFLQRRHENIEILTYVLEGTLVHTDDLGNQQIVPAGSFQLLSSGAGIEHTEANGSDEDDLHFIELSITPNQTDIRPGYQQRHFVRPESIKANFELIASSNPGTTALFLNQDADIYRFRIDKNTEFQLDRHGDSRKAYVHVISGNVKLFDGEKIMDLKSGDGLACSDIECLEFLQVHAEIAEGLLIVLPPEY